MGEGSTFNNKGDNLLGRIEVQELEKSVKA